MPNQGRPNSRLTRSIPILPPWIRRPACFVGIFAALLVATFSTMSPAIAQQVQSGVSSGAVNIPQTNLVPITPPNSSFGPSPGGYGDFDPYATTPNAGIGSSSSLIGPGGSAPTLGGGGIGGIGGAGAAPGGIAPGGLSPTGPGTGISVIGPPTATPPLVVPNTIPPSPPGSSLFSRIFSRPASTPVYGTPPQGAVLNAPPPVYGGPAPNSFGGPVYDAPSIYAPQPQPGYVPPAYPGTAYPSAAPSSLFPQGLFTNGFYSSEPFSAFRLFQGPRFQHGYVSRGSKPRPLGDERHRCVGRLCLSEFSLHGTTVSADSLLFVALVGWARRQRHQRRLALQRLQRVSGHRLGVGSQPDVRHRVRDSRGNLHRLQHFQQRQHSRAGKSPRQFPADADVDDQGVVSTTWTATARSSFRRVAFSAVRIPTPGSICFSHSRSLHVTVEPSAHETFGGTSKATTAADHGPSVGPI